MTRRKRFTYEPAKDGWVTISNTLSIAVWRSGCCQGNAQEVFKAKLDEMKREGWKLEGEGEYDSVFAHRGSERVNVAIHRRDPNEPPQPAVYWRGSPPQPEAVKEKPNT